MASGDTGGAPTNDARSATCASIDGRSSASGREARTPTIGPSMRPADPFATTRPAWVPPVAEARKSAFGRTSAAASWSNASVAASNWP